MGKRDTWRIVLVFGLALLLPSAALFGVWLGLARAGFRPQAPAKTSTPAKTTVKAMVPFSMLPSNHMVVQATINGKGPYRLIFDLGAPITLLSNQVSEASGVVKADAPRSFLFSMRGEAEVAKLQVGDLTTTKLPVIVLDHPALKILGEALGRPVDGIIGFTFFARYRTTIDYQANQMTFEPIDFPIRDLLRELPESPCRPQDDSPPRAGSRGLLGPPVGQDDWQYQLGWRANRCGSSWLSGRAGRSPAGRRADHAQQPLDNLGGRCLRSSS